MSSARAVASGRGDGPSTPRGSGLGCCPPTNCIKGMWTTRDMAESDDREVIVRTNLRELLVYVIFLMVVCILTVSTTSSTMYYYTKAMADLFLEASFGDDDNNFQGANEVSDFWKFAEGPLLDGLYWETWYDLNKTKIDEKGVNILYENRMLGVPRLRQLRVRSDSCRVADEMRVFIKACYAPFDWMTEVPNGTKLGDHEGTAWKYHSAEELDSYPFWGEISTYSGGGAYVDLASTRNETVKILQDLRKNLWIERGTRAVILDFTVYNANINLFCVIKLVFEFPATGGVIPMHSFNTVKLLRYVTPYDYFVMACEWVFIVFTVYYIIEELLELIRLKWAYLKSFWNIIDILMIVIALFCIGFSVHSAKSVNDKIQLLLKDDMQYPNFEKLGFYQSQFVSAAALCAFFAWVKLFKYISFNRTMNQLSWTLARCAKDIMGFAIMFFIVFFAFSQLGYLIFGSQVRDFKDLGTATFTLLRTILGDFDYHEIEAANRILGPMFFLSYVFFVFFVLMNMFLAIINDTYSEVKNDAAAHRDEFELADYLKRGYNNILGKFGKRDKCIDLHTALKLAKTNPDGTHTFEDILSTMKRSGFTTQEIELFFKQYDLARPQQAPDEEDPPKIDLERLHWIVFGDISVEEAAVQLRGSRAAAADGGGGSERRRPTLRPSDIDGADDYDDYDDYYDDYYDYGEIDRRDSRRSRPSSFGADIAPLREELNALSKRVDQIEKELRSTIAKIDSAYRTS